jgi:hypothetical protein
MDSQTATKDGGNASAEEAGDDPPVGVALGLDPLTLLLSPAIAPLGFRQAHGRCMAAARDRALPKAFCAEVEARLASENATNKGNAFMNEELRGWRP